MCNSFANPELHPLCNTKVSVHDSTMRRSLPREASGDAMKPFFCTVVVKDPRLRV
jgi:hypothetical protein